MQLPPRSDVVSALFFALHFEAEARREGRQSISTKLSESRRPDIASESRTSITKKALHLAVKRLSMVKSVRS